MLMIHVSTQWAHTVWAKYMILIFHITDKANLSLAPPAEQASVHYLSLFKFCRKDTIKRVPRYKIPPLSKLLNPILSKLNQMHTQQHPTYRLGSSLIHDYYAKARRVLRADAAENLTF